MDEGQRKRHTSKTTQRRNMLVPAVSRQIQSILLWLTFTLSCIYVAEFHLLCLLFHHHVLQPVSHYKSLQKSTPHLRWPSFLPAVHCRSGFGRARHYFFTSQSFIWIFFRFYRKCLSAFTRLLMWFVLPVEVVCVPSRCCQSWEPSVSEEHASVNTTIPYRDLSEQRKG